MLLICPSISCIHFEVNIDECLEFKVVFGSYLNYSALKSYLYPPHFNELAPTS